MNYQATIEFNKYTLAVAAGGIVYALEKQAPVPTLGGRVLLLCVVGALLLAAFGGVIVFAAATKALHNATPGVASPQDKVIQGLGTAHVIVLLLGLAGVAGILVHQVSAQAPAGAADLPVHSRCGTVARRAWTNRAGFPTEQRPGGEPRVVSAKT